jgi:flagellar motility protein MotE (MotC chaperone)
MKTPTLSRKLVFPLLLLLSLPANISFSTESDPQYQTVEERRIYALIEEERNKIVQERKDLELREKELKTLEASVDKKIAEIDTKLERLQNLQNRLETLLAEKTAEEKKRVQNLSAIYDKMAPERAALAMSGMEPTLATEILANMKPKAAAKVLNMLDRQKSSELSTTFSTIQLE